MIEGETDVNAQNDAKRALRILRDQIQHQIRYCLVCMNYREAHNPESQYSIAVAQARRQYYASFNIQMPERVGFALFRVKADIGDVAINDQVATLQRDMEVMCDWQDMWSYYERGDVELVADWGF